MNINELVQQAYENAREKGFWDDLMEHALMEIEGFETRLTITNNSIGNRLMLIVSELSEALEALRINDSENFKEELADVAIRLGDLCGGLDIDLEAEIIKKMEKNKSRPRLHGKAF